MYVNIALLHPDNCYVKHKCRIYNMFCLVMKNKMFYLMQMLVKISFHFRHI